MAEAQGGLSFNPAELIKRVEDTEKRLQTKDAEIQVYKMLMSQMEEELAQAKKIKAIHDKQAQDVDSIKTESEKTLTKAKSLIFERTKIIKNQELQIEAFVQQIDSLKEVVRITKDLLEIRNLEIKQLEIKISAIEGKMKAEQERYDLMHKKLEQMIRHNGELKREYEAQLCLFSALRERYNERELAKDIVEDLKVELDEEKNQVNEETGNAVNEETGNVVNEETGNVVNEETGNVVNEETGNSEVSKETIGNVVKNEHFGPSEPDKNEQTNDTKTVVEIAPSNKNEDENIHIESNNSALVDAKNRLDNILSVLENTLGLDNTASTESDNKTETVKVASTNNSENVVQENNINSGSIPIDATKTEQVDINKSQTDVIINSKLTNNSQMADEKTSLVNENLEEVAETLIDETANLESKMQANANSALDNIISVLKNTIGLGSGPLPENKALVGTENILENSTNNPQNSDKKD